MLKDSPAVPIPLFVLKRYLAARSTALEAQRVWRTAVRMYGNNTRAQLEFATWKANWEPTRLRLVATLERFAESCQMEGTDMAELKRQALALDLDTVRADFYS